MFYETKSTGVMKFEIAWVKFGIDMCQDFGNFYLKNIKNYY